MGISLATVLFWISITEIVFARRFRRTDVSGPGVIGMTVRSYVSAFPFVAAISVSNFAAAAAEAGAAFCGYVALRLPFAVKTLFEQWLEQYYPEKKNKVLNRLREIRDGKLNDPNFTTRMRGNGIFAEQMAELFQLAQKKSGINKRWPKLTTEHFRRPARDQLSLF